MPKGEIVGIGMMIGDSGTVITDQPLREIVIDGNHVGEMAIMYESTSR